MLAIVVDDSAITGNLVQRALQELGCEVRLRTSPLGTVRVVLSEKPELVVVDLNMPALSGDELVRLIKKSVPHLCVLLISSEPKEVLEAAAVASGADGWIEKNNPELLTPTLALWLQRVKAKSGG